MLFGKASCRVESTKNLNEPFSYRKKQHVHIMLLDLVFILLVLGTFGTMMAVVAILGLGRRKAALKLSVFYVIGLALYLGVLIAVSLTSPQRVIAMGEDRCFDDWCIAVEDISFAQELGNEQIQAQAKGVFYIVNLRISNQARGRDQRAGSAAVHLLDPQGQIYNVSPSGQEAYEIQVGSTSSLTATLSLGQSLNIVQVFDLPKDVQEVALTVEHPVGLSPDLLIIGSEASLFHKPTIVHLP